MCVFAKRASRLSQVPPSFSITATAHADRYTRRYETVRYTLRWILGGSWFRAASYTVTGDVPGNWQPYFIKSYIHGLI